MQLLREELDDEKRDVKLLREQLKVLPRPVPVATTTSTDSAELNLQK
jgi:hypothetical protein